MQIPLIGHTQFLILSAASDGRPRMIPELMDRLDWDKSRETLIQRSSSLHKSGLISKEDHLLRGGKTQRVYVITPEGRRAVQESTDFYLTVIERFQTKADRQEPDKPAVLSRKPIKPSVSPSARERIATPAEFERLMMHAEEHFARCYRVLWVLNASDDRIHFRRGVSAIEVIGLKIADADLENGTLTIQGRRVVLDELSQEAVQQAAGGRERGPLFLARNGRPYTSSSIATIFRQTARQAGLPPEVKTSGRTDSWRYRSNVQRKA